MTIADFIEITQQWIAQGLAQKIEYPNAVYAVYITCDTEKSLAIENQIDDLMDAGIIEYGNEYAEGAYIVDGQPVGIFWFDPFEV